MEKKKPADMTWAETLSDKWSGFKDFFTLSKNKLEINKGWMDRYTIANMLARAGSWGLSWIW
jgi:hypothetical protein